MKNMLRRIIRKNYKKILREEVTKKNKQTIQITERRLRSMIRRIIFESSEDDILGEPDINSEREDQEDELEEYSAISGGVGSIRGYQGSAFNPDPEKPKGWPSRR